MDISEVAITLSPNPNKVLGFADVIISAELKVCGIKIIQGDRGPFLSMPSRKRNDHCQRCGGKNCLMANFCNWCGTQLPKGRALPDPTTGKLDLYVDHVYPIKSAARKQLESHIFSEWERVKILEERAEAQSQEGL